MLITLLSLISTHTSLKCLFEGLEPTYHFSIFTPDSTLSYLLYLGDVDRAFHLVIASNGLEQTQFLAKSYGKAALHSIQLWKDSHAKDELLHFIQTAIERTK